jgi:hypothetical protein
MSICDLYGGRKSLLFFEKKRSKKNFYYRVCGTARATRREAEQSFFGSFFSKKELLSCSNGAAT